MDAVGASNYVGHALTSKSSPRSDAPQSPTGRSPQPVADISRRRRRPGTRWLFIVAAMVASGAGTWLYMVRRGPDVQFRTAVVVRGDLTVTINATGTVEPEEVVDVGAQVAGKIRAFGEDPEKPGHTIDYGSHVEQGTILASIDDALYAADVASTAALLEQAKANVLRSEADIKSRLAAQDQAAASLELAQIEFDRISAIPSEAQAPVELLIADAQLKQARAGFAAAKANVKVGDAALEQAGKGVMQAEAALNRSKTNLEYCTIRSPVNGVIIDRRVNIGQTVVSSLNAPSLFLIAKDLKRILVWASVNEADIGAIHPGQTAVFRVDAYPGRTFAGEVGKTRLNAAMTQNVVTYTVEVHTDNADGLLLPYLTANVQFQVATHNDVLMAPNMALRWTPPSALVAPSARASGRGEPAVPPMEPGAEASHLTDIVWVVEGKFVRPIRVHAGATNGVETEIAGREIYEGLWIVTGERPPESNATGATSPFTPQMFRRQ